MGKCTKSLFAKKASDPVYSGLIYIADSTYAVTELDLRVTRQQNIDLLDSMRISKPSGPVGAAWMPLQFTSNQHVKIDLMGIKIPIHGLTTTLTNRYQTGIDLDKSRFRGPIIAVKPKATSLSPAAWDNRLSSPQRGPKAGLQAKRQS
ncbi:MAG: DUF5686 family protein [Bacteroidia bacterium]